MLNTLLFLHLVIALLLIFVILLQKTSTTGVSGIGSGGNSMGIVSSRTALNLLIKTTIVLAIMFFINAIILANLSTQGNNNLISKLGTTINKESVKKQSEKESIPIAH